MYYSFVNINGKSKFSILEKNIPVICYELHQIFKEIVKIIIIILKCLRM